MLHSLPNKPQALVCWFAKQVSYNRCHWSKHCWIYENSWRVRLWCILFMLAVVVYTFSL